MKEREQAMDEQIDTNDALSEQDEVAGAGIAGPDDVVDAQSVSDQSFDLARVRELVLSANPDVVPEMVQGTTFDELMASVDPARDAYRRIVEQAKAAEPGPRVATQPGGRGTALHDVESLSPLAKIREGLRRG
jgi:hypothetical protein